MGRATMRSGLGRMVSAIPWYTQSMTHRMVRSAHSLIQLPYAEDALVPWLSARTVKRHRAYEAQLVHGLNEALQGSDLEHRPLDEIVTVAANDPNHLHEYNHAAEVWNHTFYWGRLKPGGGSAPPGELTRWIVRDFGDFASLETQICARARGVWGNGWTWLVLDRDTLRLHVVNSCGIMHPLAVGLKPLLAIDLWEHAYMLDYGTDRESYVRSMLALVDWQLVLGDILAAASLVDEHTKLKYLLRLSIQDMRRLKHVMVQHGTIDLTETPSLTKLGVLGSSDSPAARSLIDAAMQEVLMEDAATAASTRRIGNR